MPSFLKFLQPNIDKLKAKGDIQGLIRALAYKKVTSVRWEAAKALGELRNAQAIDALANALRDEDLRVKEKVVDALGEIGSERAIKPLVSALTDEDWRVRKQAQWALFHISPTWTQLEDITKIVPDLIGKLKRFNTIEDDVVELLGNIGDPRSVPALVSLIQFTNKSRYNDRAVEAILQALDRILRHPKASTPSNTLDEIAKLPNPVIRGRKDEDWDYQYDFEEEVDISFLRNLAKNIKEIDNRAMDERIRKLQEEQGKSLDDLQMRLRNAQTGKTD